MSKFTELVQKNIQEINEISLYGAEKIGNYAFTGTTLEKITIPKTVTSIGNSAFRDCINLTSITIPNSVTSILDLAFYNCNNLTSITIPNSVLVIGNAAFYGCSKLTEITIPNSVTSIGNWAFYGCSSLIDCTILRTSGVITLGSNNFNSINNKIYVPYSLLKSYKEATNWVGITDKIMGYQTFANGEILPRYNTTHTFTWYPSKADLIAGTNGIIADGTTRATSAGEWYCERPRIQVAVVTDLINSSKTTSFIRPTSSSNANQTEYINFDTVASTTQYPIVINCSVISYENTSGATTNYTNQTINYGQIIEFKNPKSSNSNHKLTVRFDATGGLYIEMFGYYHVFTAEYWQQITINSIKQTTYEYQN